MLQIDETYPDFTHTGYSVTHDTLMLLAVSATGAMDTVLRMPASESLNWLAPTGMRLQLLDMPLRAEMKGALANDVIVIADGIRRQLEIRSSDGALRALSRVRPDNVRTVSEADRDRFVEFTVERAEFGSADPAERRRNARDQIEMVPDGHAIPPFDLILADGSNVWVRDYVPPWSEDSPRTWTVLDGEGRAVARVTTPAGVTVTHVAPDRITGIARGEFDEQYVVVHRLVRGAPSQ